MKETKTGQHDKVVILPSCPDSTPPVPTLRIDFKIGREHHTFERPIATDFLSAGIHGSRYPFPQKK
jgi:hypothetical protein